MIRIAIVEDEDIFAHQMEEYLLRYQQERNQCIRTTFFRDGDEIVERYSGDFDIIFMDIQMEFLDGMTAAELIRQMDPEVTLIFITNMTQYAIKGYSVGALDYVLKPITYFAFSQRLDKAISGLRKKEAHYIIISAAGHTRKLNTDHIYYIESQNHTLHFYTRNGDFSAPYTMQQMERELASDRTFFRCNKGCLINLEYVDSIRDNCAIVNHVALPISRGKKRALMAALTEYINGGLK